MSENNIPWLSIGAILIIGVPFLLMGVAISGPDISDIIRYELPIPETNCTHVKLSVIHDVPGARDQEHNFKIQEIPEYGKMLYKLDYEIKHIFVFMDFYIKSGSGYTKIHSENYFLENLVNRG